MIDMISLDEEFSTTRLLTKEKPVIVNNPKDRFESVLFLPEAKNRKGEGGLRTRGYFKNRYEDKPLISIVTVVYNGEEFLEETILSVINQSYDNVEYIIIDGGSSDGTLDIIKKYEDRVDYWVSEQDAGIYDAMNKGIDASSGNGLLFLNAGDYFVSDVLNDNIIVPSFIKVKYKNFFGNYTDVKLKNYKSGLPNCHQGIIFENLKKKYNLEYKIAADYDFYLQHEYNIKLPILKVKGYIHYDNNGFSKKNAKIRDNEIADIIKSNFGLLFFLKFKIIIKIKDIIKMLIKNN